MTDPAGQRWGNAPDENERCAAGRRAGVAMLIIGTITLAGALIAQMQSHRPLDRSDPALASTVRMLDEGAVRLHMTIAQMLHTGAIVYACIGVPCEVLGIGLLKGNRTAAKVATGFTALLTMLMVVSALGSITTGGAAGVFVLAIAVGLGLVVRWAWLASRGTSPSHAVAPAASFGRRSGSAVSTISPWQHAQAFPAPPAGDAPLRLPNLLPPSPPDVGGPMSH